MSLIPKIEMNTAHIIRVFESVIADYHIKNSVDQPIQIAADDYSDWSKALYRKCWIDTVQWHLEDIIRDPNIDAQNALSIKRRIDKSNQDRTDLVEELDDRIVHHLSPPKPEIDARINTESPGWAIDRLSILCLKIYHMAEEANRKDAGDAHRVSCQAKLDVLMYQQRFLSKAIDQLFEDVKQGKRIIKTYRQMKMYNDADLNPILYSQKGN